MSPGATALCPLRPSRDDDFTISLGSLLEKKAIWYFDIFLISTLFKHNQSPFPLILSLFAWERKRAPTCLHPPVRELKKARNSPCWTQPLLVLQTPSPAPFHSWTHSRSSVSFSSQEPRPHHGIWDAASEMPSTRGQPLPWFCWSHWCWGWLFWGFGTQMPTITSFPFPQGHRALARCRDFEKMTRTAQGFGLCKSWTDKKYPGQLKHILLVDYLHCTFHFFPTCKKKPTAKPGFHTWSTGN